jgi:hypothetical protein
VPPNVSFWALTGSVKHKAVSANAKRILTGRLSVVVIAELIFGEKHLEQIY